MLQQQVQCRSVLALTATATKATEADVANVLGIQQQNVVRDSNVRDNLRLAVTACNGGELGMISQDAPCGCTTWPWLALMCAVCGVCPHRCTQRLSCQATAPTCMSHLNEMLSSACSLAKASTHCCTFSKH